MKPDSSQTTISQPALPTFLTISELTMNIPEPIMEPITMRVPSSKVSDRLKEDVFSNSVILQEKYYLFFFVVSLLFSTIAFMPFITSEVIFNSLLL